MNRGTVSFLLAIILFVVIAVTWAKVGGFAQAYQESNAKVWAGYDPQFASPTDCQGCHGKVYGVWVAASHKTVNCQNCHGPAGKHIQGEGKPFIDTSRDLCALCHNKITGRRADFPAVDVTKHNPDQAACTNCHNPHSPSLGRSGGK